MLGENIKYFRHKRGLTQENFAARLHVVRQTVSKWEKGRSVPDAEMLCRIADLLATDVKTLLSDPVREPARDDKIAEDAGNTETEAHDSPDLEHLAAALAGINAELALRNRRTRRFRKILGLFLLGFFFFFLLLTIFNLFTHTSTHSKCVTKQIVSDSSAGSEKGTVPEDS